jgi:hypothetical protein
LIFNTCILYTNEHGNIIFIFTLKDIVGNRKNAEYCVMDNIQTKYIMVEKAILSEAWV